MAAADGELPVTGAGPQVRAVGHVVRPVPRHQEALERHALKDVAGLVIHD